MSWLRSPALRERLVASAAKIKVPTMFVHAANDYSIEPGRVLDAEVARRRVVHRLTIYPAYGRTQSDGHGLLYLDPTVWERDVFGFLSTYLGPTTAGR